MTLNYTVGGPARQTQFKGAFVLNWFKPDGWTKNHLLAVATG